MNVIHQYTMLPNPTIYFLPNLWTHFDFLHTFYRFKLHVYIKIVDMIAYWKPKHLKTQIPAAACITDQSSVQNLVILHAFVHQIHVHCLDEETSLEVKQVSVWTNSEQMCLRVNRLWANKLRWTGGRQCKNLTPISYDIIRMYKVYIWDSC